MTHDEHKRDAFQWAVAGITLVALGLRLHALGRDGFWLDEVYTVHYSSVPLAAIPRVLAFRSVHPPLFFMLVHPWIAAFGDAEWAVRMTSAIAGTSSIPLAAIYGRALFDKRVGILSAVLLATAPYHIYQSQNARPYALLGTLVLALLICHLRALEAPSRRWNVLHVLVSVAVVYTHVFGLVTVLALNVHYALVRWRRPSLAAPRPVTWISMQLVVGACFAPWTTALRMQIGHRETAWGWIPEPNLTTVWRTFEEEAFGSTWRAVLALGLAVFVIAVGASRRRATWPVREGALGWWIVAPIAIPVLVSKLYHPIYWPRYAIESLVAGQVAAAGAIGVLLAHRLLGVRLLGVGALLALVLRFADLRSLYRDPQNEDWRAVARYLNDVAAPEDVVVSDPAFLATAIEFYRDGHKHLDSIPSTFLGSATGPQRFAWSRWGEELARRATHRVWVVLWVPPAGTESIGSTPPLRRSYDGFLGAAFRVGSDRSFYGARVVMFERR